MLKHILAGQQPSSNAGSRLQHHSDINGNEHINNHNGKGGGGSHSNNEYSLAGNNVNNGDPNVSISSAHPRAPLDQQFYAHQQSHHHKNHPTIQELQMQFNNSGRSIRAASVDVYDNVSYPAASNGMYSRSGGPHHFNHRQQSATPSNDHRYGSHQLNYPQQNVSLPHKLNASHHFHELNMSARSTSKHSVNSISPVVNANILGGNSKSPGAVHTSVISNQILDRSKLNGGLDISRISMRSRNHCTTPSPASHTHQATLLPSNGDGVVQPVNVRTTTSASAGASILPLNVSWFSSSQKEAVEAGIKEILTSLGLLCLVSLLLALLSLTFLLRISHNGSNGSPMSPISGFITREDFEVIYNVTLVLCALALSLNLCCLLVCAIQFLFAAKLIKSTYHGYRTNTYLQKSSMSRMCAVGGFFISIPVFLTGMILYTFIQFQSTPAIVTSIFIGAGIVFCGCAVVHNVFLWQKEKTNAMKTKVREQYEAASQLHRQQNAQHQNHQQLFCHPQHTHSSQSHCIAQHHHQHNSHNNPRSYPIQLMANTSVRDLNHPPFISGSITIPQQHHQQAFHRSQQVGMSPVLSSAPHPQGHFNLPPGVAHPRAVQAQIPVPPVTPSASSGDRSPTTRDTSTVARTQQFLGRETTRSISPGIPPATVDLSTASNANKSAHELSTLV